MKPSVSVIIPTYKRPESLGRAIDSVLNQTFKNIDVIVIDDNNDGDEFRLETETFMKRYRQNNKVKYFKHAKNKNGAAARNTGIKATNSDYIAFLDDDDFYLPDKIEKQVNKIKGLEEVWGGISCQHYRRYKEFTYKKISITEKNGGNYTAEFLSDKISLPTSTLLIRKCVFETIGGFDESYYRHQDLEFLVRFFRHYKMAIIHDYDVVMQTESIRNFPSAQRSLDIKDKFLSSFSKDIDKLTKVEISQILHYHWMMVVCFFLQERKISKAYSLLKTSVLPHTESVLKDIKFVLFFLVIGYLPLMKILYMKFMGTFIYKNKELTKIKEN